MGSLLQFSYLVIGVTMVIVEMAKAQPNSESESMLMDLSDDAEGRQMASCCHSPTIQGMQQIYSPNSALPAELRFYVDSLNDRMALSLPPLGPIPSSADRRIVINCLNRARMCFVTHIYERLGYCTRSRISNVTLDSFWSRCMPRYSKMTKRLRMGISRPFSGQSMVLQQWAFYSGLMDVRRLVTAIGCYPVADVVTVGSRVPPVDRLSVYYFDLETSISDKSVFKLPIPCLQMDEEDIVNDGNAEPSIYDHLLKLINMFE